MSMNASNSLASLSIMPAHFQNAFLIVPHTSDAHTHYDVAMREHNQFIYEHGQPVLMTVVAVNSFNQSTHSIHVDFPLREYHFSCYMQWKCPWTTLLFLQKL
jgi:hypothetical protein